MWDCLVKISTWAESNSGQIQIGIGLLALGYAYKAYKKVLEQIDISLDNQEQANKQSQAELKIHLLNTLTNLFDDLAVLNGELTTLINQLNSFLTFNENKINDPELSALESFKNSFIDRLKECEGYKNSVHKIVNNIIEDNNLTVQKMNEILKMVYVLSLKVKNEQAEHKGKSDGFNIIMNNLNSSN